MKLVTNINHRACKVFKCYPTHGQYFKTTFESEPYFISFPFMVSLTHPLIFSAIMRKKFRLTGENYLNSCVFSALIFYYITHHTGKLEG
jgi:hypothetical protein